MVNIIELGLKEHKILKKKSEKKMHEWLLWTINLWLNIIDLNLKGKKKLLIGGEK